MFYVVLLLDISILAVSPDNFLDYIYVIYSNLFYDVLLSINIGHNRKF